MIHRSTARRATRLLAPLAAMAALLLPAALSAGAQASVPGAHRAAKAGRHARRTGRHVRRHHAHHRGAHKPKKTARHPAAPAVELIPAACEDGTLPSHSGGGAYSCEDGSAPACEEGTLRTAASSAPMCAVPPAGEDECAREGSACPSEIEFDCEDPASAEASANCERAGETEAPEPEEEEE